MNKVSSVNLNDRRSSNIVPSF